MAKAGFEPFLDLAEEVALAVQMKLKTNWEELAAAGPQRT